MTHIMGKEAKMKITGFFVDMNILSKRRVKTFKERKLNGKKFRLKERV